MTMLWIDGFDGYATGAQFLEKWDSYSSSSFFTSGGRTGGMCRMANDFNGPRKSIPAGAHATWVVGFAMDKRSQGGQQSLSFYSNEFAQPQCCFLFDTRVSAKVFGSGNVPGDTSGNLGQSPVASVPTNGYDYYECKVVLSATVGEMSVHKNGVEILHLTGVNNKPNSGTTVDAIQFQTYNGQPDIDDVYILNGAGSVNNDFLGDCRVRQLTVSGAGSNTAFTPSSGSNYQTVDEVPFSTADYNTGTTDGAKDTYAMSDVTDPGNAVIFAVMESAVVAKTDAGTKFGATVVRSGGTDYVRTSQPLSMAFRDYVQIEEKNPATNTGWTVATINAAEFGVAAKDS